MSQKKLFAEDEMEVKVVDPEISRNELLNQEGLFMFKDIGKILGIQNDTLKIHARRLKRQRRNPYKAIGIRKLSGHWLVRMKVFAPYYRENLEINQQSVLDHWDIHDLLAQEGTFKLADVCKKMPFKLEKLRSMAKKNPESGIFKNGTWWFVDMKRFSRWISDFWPKDEKVKQ